MDLSRLCPVQNRLPPGEPSENLSKYSYKRYFQHGTQHPDEPEPKMLFLATEDTEDTEVKKFLLSVNSVLSVAKKISRESARFYGMTVISGQQHHEISI